MTTLDALQAQIDDLKSRLPRDRPKPSDGSPHVIFRLARPDLAQLERLAADQKCSKSDVIRRALAPVLQPETGMLTELGSIPTNFLSRTQAGRKQGTDADRMQIAVSIAANVALIDADAASRSRNARKNGRQEVKAAIPVNPGAETVPKASRKGISGMKER